MRRKYTFYLPLADAEQAARGYLADVGHRPTKRSGIITHDPLKDINIDWQKVYSYFYTNKPGGYEGFADFMDKRGIVNQRIALDDIAASARATYEATGRRPSKLGQLVEYGPLKGKELKWCNIDADFKRGLYAGFKTLADFLDSRNIGVRRFTLQMVEKSIRQTMDATGGIVSRNSGPVLYGPLKKLDTTWENVYSAFKQGHSGLKKSGFYSLTQFRETRDIKPTLHILFSDMASITAATQTVPGLTAAFNDAAAGKIRKWERLLANDKIKGWEFYMPGLEKRPKSVLEFCLAAGLAKNQDGKITPASAKEIETLSLVPPSRRPRKKGLESLPAPV
jgi:hypothetical protein